MHRISFQTPILCLPEALGAIVVAYNIPSSQTTSPLNLTSELISRIFQLNITQWNDATIQAWNPQLPSTFNIPIRVCVRGDSAGTTYGFTDFLSASTSAWTLGRSARPQWINGTSLVSGSVQMAGCVNSTVGSIGYIQYANAKLTGLSSLARIQNRDGVFLDKEEANVSATAASVTLPQTMPAGKTSHSCGSMDRGPLPPSRTFACTRIYLT
jgi:ABC-type phosphate transport system substrate-binding protein